MVRLLDKASVVPVDSVVILSPASVHEVEPEPLLVTVKEAAKLLRCGRSTIYEMLKAGGGLERRKLGNATRITMASIRKLAEG